MINKINKESQSQQAVGVFFKPRESKILWIQKIYFPGLKLENNRSKLRGIKPNLSNKSL